MTATARRPMRTPEEIVQHLRAIRSYFGFADEVLVPYLPLVQAREFLRAEAYTDGWTQHPQDADVIKNDMLTYLAFAWKKAEDHRGISASRSVEKMRAWLWLLGDDEALAFAKADKNYPNYGAPVLAYISRRYSQPMPTSPEVMRMVAGLPCRPGCDGCQQEILAMAKEPDAPGVSYTADRAIIAGLVSEVPPETVLLRTLGLEDPNGTK